MAGCGKSTLVQKIGWDWSEGGQWQEQFTIIVVLALRQEEVRRAVGVAELFGLKAKGITADSDQKAIVDFIQDHANRVCIILDGLDETSLSQCSQFVQDVINGEELVGVRLLVTSRHTKEVHALSTEFNRRVELVGFSKESCKEYVRNVLDAQASAKSSVRA